MPCFFKKIGWQSLLHRKMNLNIILPLFVILIFKVLSKHNRDKVKFITEVTQTWKKTIFTPARFEQKIFYPRKCVTCYKSEFATKHSKMCLCLSKIRLPHICRSNNYVIIQKNPLLTAIFKNLPIKNP